jgi:hypothetical protein
MVKVSMVLRNGTNIVLAVRNQSMTKHQRQLLKIKRVMYAALKQ